MDITETLAPKSDQLDAVDLLGSPPRTFTVTSVSPGPRDQPVNVHLAEFDRVWRPGKSMRRVLAACWGTDASKWTGRRVELFCDPNVLFGGEKVGGTRISRLSHIADTQSVPLLVKKGKSAPYVVEPLADAAPTMTAADVTDLLAGATTEAEVREIGNRAHGAGLLDDALKTAVTNRLNEVTP